MYSLELKKKSDYAAARLSVEIFIHAVSLIWMPACTEQIEVGYSLPNLYSFNSSEF